MTQQDLKALVLEHVNSPDYQPVKPRTIAKQLGLSKDRHGELRKAVRKLAKQGKVVYGDLNPAFHAAIEDVPDGGYSEPVEMAAAVYLLRINQRLPGGLRQFDEVKFDIYQTILDQKTDARINEWTKSLKTKAYIDIRL